VELFERGWLEADKDCDVVRNSCREECCVLLPLCWEPGVLANNKSMALGWCEPEKGKLV